MVSEGGKGLLILLSHYTACNLTSDVHQYNYHGKEARFSVLLSLLGAIWTTHMKVQ